MVVDIELEDVVPVRDVVLEVETPLCGSVDEILVAVVCLVEEDFLDTATLEVVVELAGI